MAAIRPFRVEVSSAALDRLHAKLDLTRFPDEPEAGLNYGASVPEVKRLTAYWQSGFDWKKQEARLNELPHFKTKVEVDGFGELDIHFIHQQSNVSGAIPLLFVHGWPGSFLEVIKLLPFLKDGTDGPSFHIVAPSLPNYGFSSGISKKGFSIPQYAEALRKTFLDDLYSTNHTAPDKVMTALGYNQYVTQGGDWGFVITRALAHLYPKSVKALHSNWPYAPFPSFTASPVLAATSLFKHALGSYFYTKREATDLAHAKETARGAETGYLALVSTKPTTLAFSLSDSPVGLLAFIYEKLASWTDDYAWTDDEILTWISIYWFSDAGPGACGHIYKESRDDKIWTLQRFQGWIDQPLGFRYFPKELASLPKAWLSGMGRVVLIGESDKGGHFGAYERPEDIAKDLKDMFGHGGGAFEVVEGRSGY